ncbi:MAG: HNH endonuclease [Bryobacteraceae bacterium]|nr:HNH endonuclease [Bryobacteraceae bacterium]
MITPLTNESGVYDMALTLGYERTESGFPRFRFEFRPVPGFWVDSEWFVPSTSRPEVAYREERKPLSDLSPLDAAYIEWGKSMARVREALRETMGIEDICTLRARDESGPPRYFAYRRGMIWQSPMNLKPDQWKRMIDEEAENLGLILNQSDSPQQDRTNRSIPVPAPRSWRRDQGRCVTCGSQERLEYDHVIPVAMGGSNTVRNIQLVCERCNREKAATLG